MKKICEAGRKSMQLKDFSFCKTQLEETQF